MPSYQFKINGQPIRGGAVISVTGPAVISCVSDHEIGWWSINYDGGDPDGNAVSSIPVVGSPNEWRYEQPLGPGFYNVRTSNTGTPEVRGGTEGGWINFELRAAAFLPGFISDNGSVQRNVIDATELGMGKAVRLWAGFDAVTGQFQNAGDINLIKAYRAAGVFVFATLSPTENAPSVARPTGAIRAIKASCPRDGVVWEGFNEVNMPRYFRQGWKTAFALWDDCGSELRADGRQTGSCTFTYQTPSSIVAWWNEAIANGWGKDDWVCGHNYPSVGSWVPSAIDNARAVNNAYASVARPRGKKLAITEYAMYGDKSKFAEALPLMNKVMSETADAAMYYILREKADNAEFGLHLIDAAGNYTALGNAAKAVAEQGSVI